MKAAFLGLGQMGQGMAENLAKAGRLSCVYNRTPEKARPFESKGIRLATSAADAAKDADIVFSMLADDKALEAICFGPHGLLSAPKPGAIHVSMSTVSVAFMKHLEDAHRQAGQTLLSCPVFGRPEAAAAAKLWVLCAGPSEAAEQAKPFLETMGQGVFPVAAEPWKANLMKLSGNFLIASIMESLSEAYALIEKSGADARKFHEILTSSILQNPIYVNYGSMLLNKKFEPAGFQLALGLKDLSLFLKAADTQHAPVPAARVIHSHYLTGVAQGLGKKDWSAIREVIDREMGLSSV